VGRIFKGWNAKIFFGDLEIGVAKSVNVDYESSIEPYYGIEDPNIYPVTSVDQLNTINISGSIKRAWLNSYYLRLLLGGSSQTLPGTFVFDLRLMASEEGGSPIFYLYNCRFNKGSISISQDGWIEESFDFIAFSAGTGLVPSCPSGEQLINGGFEVSGGNYGIPYWDSSVYYTSWSNPHSGTKCIMAYPSGWIEQELAEPLPVSCVDSITCWAKGEINNFVEVIVTITYTDDTTSEDIKTTINDDGEWEQLTFGNLTTGKTIKKIKFDGANSYNPHKLDDCSLMATG
jgi:hypothetical protein